MIQNNYFGNITGNPKVLNFRASILVNLIYICSPRMIFFVEKIISDLLEKEIITHSNSPYASPTVLTKNNNGEENSVYLSQSKLPERDNYPLFIIIFQEFVTEIFNDFLERNEIVIYMDDVMVASRTHEEHLEILRRILDSK